jgi:hypothetical protein
MKLQRILKENIWWPIKHRIVHPRKAYRDAVFPFKHRSIEDILVASCLNAVIESVDVHGYFNKYRTDVDENWRTFAAELRECYEYAVINRALLVKKIETAWLDLPEDGPDFKLVMTLEGELHSWDTEVCRWVINNRSKLMG